MNNSPLIRFQGYSNSWKNLKLKEQSKLITKGTTPKNKTIKGDINYIKVENLRSGKIFVSSKISENEHFSFLKRSILHDGDILFSIAGTLGRAAIVRKSILPANTNQALAIIRGYNFNSTFLLTALSGKVVREYVQKNPTVGAQPNLSLEQVGNLIISSPSIEEQNEIGIFFEKIDDTIALHQQELDTLKQTKQGFLQKMFPRKGEKIPEIRFTEFKSEWQKIRLGDQSIIKGRLGWKSLKQEEYILDGPALIAGKHIKNGRVKWDKVDHIPKWRYDESPEIMLENGDVIFSKDGSLGNPALIEDLKIPATINSTMMLVRVNKTLDPLFFYQVMVSNTFKRLVYLKVSGSSIPHLFQADMNDFTFLIPEKSEQVKIGEFFKQLDEVIELKEQELEALKQTKKGFLQKMFV